LANSPGVFVRDDPIVPYSIQGDQVCDHSGGVTALVTLPPSAAIRYEFHLSTDDIIDFLFMGFSKEGCPDSSAKLESDNVWILSGTSIVVYIMGYYFHILIICFAITLVFLIIILFKKTNTTQAEFDT
jgi:hypothetical protein